MYITIIYKYDTLKWLTGKSSPTREPVYAWFYAGGQLVMTGILAEQADAVMAAYMDWFVFEEPVYREEWVLLEGTRQND